MDSRTDSGIANRLRLQGQEGDQRIEGSSYLGVSHPSLPAYHWQLADLSQPSYETTRKLWCRQVEVPSQPSRPSVRCFVPNRESQNLLREASF